MDMDDGTCYMKNCSKIMVWSDFLEMYNWYFGYFDDLYTVQGN